MDVIDDVRRRHDINAANPCFFASDTADGYADHCCVLRELSRDAGVKRPDLIRSTKLRKCMASVMQVFWSAFSAFLISATCQMYGERLSLRLTDNQHIVWFTCVTSF